MHFYVNSELQHVRVCCRVLNQRHLLKGWMGDWGAKHGSEESKMESAAIHRAGSMLGGALSQVSGMDPKSNVYES
jgi:hypothetical protein